jgi:hypothetical protein
MQLQIAGKPANIDWVHVLQIGLGVAMIVLVQVAKMPNLSANIVSALVLIATIVGLVYRSIFHEDPPRPRDGGVSIQESTSTVLKRTLEETNPRWRLFTHPFASRRAFFRNAVGMTTTIALFAFTGSVGCGPQLAGWLANISQFLSYVTTFIQGAQALWAIVSPLLAIDVRGKADAEFARAIQATTDAQAAGEELVAAAVNGTGPTPNIAAIIASVQTAAAQIYAVIQLYSRPVSGAPRIGVAVASTEHQYRVLAAWKA